MKTVSATPAVSVIVPMRNAAPFIGAALQSVLSQEDVALEVIIVDDGSTDGSAAIVRNIGDSRARLMEGSCSGIAACLNLGFSAARAEILMRCDADDVFPPGRVAAQVNWLIANSAYGAVCGGYDMMSISTKPVAQFGSGREDIEEDIQEELKCGVMRTHLCAFAWRKSLFMANDMFRNYFETAEDLDFQMRLGESCKVRFRPGVAYCYRLHDDSITHRQGSSRRIFFEETARRFQLQRRVKGVDDLQRGHPPQPPHDALDAPTTTSEQVQGILVGRAWFELSKGRRLSAIDAALSAIFATPFRVLAWTTFAKVFVRSIGLKPPG